MTEQKRLTSALPGIWRIGEYITIGFQSEKENCGMVLFDKAFREILKISFSKKMRKGNLFALSLKGLPKEAHSYCFYEDDTYLTDSRGKAFLDHPKYGTYSRELLRFSLLADSEFDWEQDRLPGIDPADCVVYVMHVRGFTRHASSKVKNRGCFSGIVEKIPYLKELGVTTLELQPCYEFPELEALGEVPLGEDSLHQAEGKAGRSTRINYWGYTRGLYYAPKSSYANSKEPWTEFKRMVKELHQQRLECIMQFYFEKDISIDEILLILRYWMDEYHVDGFHLKGNFENPQRILRDASLSKTKLWIDLPEESFGQSFHGQEHQRFYRASCQNSFQREMRRFLKGDGGMVHPAICHVLRKPEQVSILNYLTNYDGFTLKDMVSYQEKHNEENGEHNQDGCSINDTWNCGTEGSTRKKDICLLRKKQMANAVLLLFLSLGTPLFFMGDEFENTQGGNNNPYCQDTDTTWLNWKFLEKNHEFFSFFRSVIEFRKKHGVFKKTGPLKMTDSTACGYPEVSLHGSTPWKLDADFKDRHFCVLYYNQEGKRQDIIYVIYNMHWNKKEFRLPMLPKEYQWICEYNTQQGNPEPTKTIIQEKIEIDGRSICVLIGETKKNKRKTRNAERKDKKR